MAPDTRHFGEYCRREERRIQESIERGRAFAHYLKRYYFFADITLNLFAECGQGDSEYVRKALDNLLCPKIDPENHLPDFSSEPEKQLEFHYYNFSRRRVGLFKPDRKDLSFLVSFPSEGLEIDKLSEYVSEDNGGAPIEERYYSVLDSLLEMRRTRGSGYGVSYVDSKTGESRIMMDITINLNNNDLSTDLRQVVMILRDSLK